MDRSPAAEEGRARDDAVVAGRGNSPLARSRSRIRGRRSQIRRTPNEPASLAGADGPRRSEGTTRGQEGSPTILPGFIARAPRRPASRSATPRRRRVARPEGRWRRGRTLRRSGLRRALRRRLPGQRESGSLSPSARDEGRHQPDHRGATDSGSCKLVALITENAGGNQCRKRRPEAESLPASVVLGGFLDCDLVVALKGRAVCSFSAMACSFSAMRNMRSAAPGSTSSYPRKMSGGGSDPERRFVTSWAE